MKNPLTNTFTRVTQSAKTLVLEDWQSLVLYVGSFIVFFGIYIFRLSSLTNQKAALLETTTIAHGSSWHAIYNDPLNAPYFVTLRLLRYLHGGLLTVRLASVFWSLVAIFLFFLVVRRLHGIFIASLGTILFATSAWVLHIGRLAAPDVLLLSAGLGILLLFLRKKPTGDKPARTRSYPLWFLTILLIGGLYVSGIIWLIILAAFVRSDVMKSAWTVANVKQRILSVLLFILLLVPFVRACIKMPRIFITNWLAVTPNIPKPGHVLHQFVMVPDNLFWHGPSAPILWLGRLPMIEIATAIFAVIGAYYYIRHFAQTSLLLVIPAIAWLLIAFGDGGLITIVAAFIYIYAAGGISYTLRRWQKIFPRNPIARATALIAIISIVGLITIYNTRQYFVAWAYNDATRGAYQQKL